VDSRGDAGFNNILLSITIGRNAPGEESVPGDRPDSLLPRTASYGSGKGDSVDFRVEPSRKSGQFRVTDRKSEIAKHSRLPGWLGYIRGPEGLLIGLAQELK